MYLLDTDTVSGVFRRQIAITARIQNLDWSEVWISSIVVEEMVGRQINRINTLRSAKRGGLTSASTLLAQLMQHLQRFQILSYTDEAEELYRSFTAQEKRIGPNDCRIAASAIISNLVVVTCNQKDFSRISNVKFEDWSQ